VNFFRPLQLWIEFCGRGIFSFMRAQEQKVSFRPHQSNTSLIWDTLLFFNNIGYPMTFNHDVPKNNLLNLSSLHCMVLNIFHNMINFFRSFSVCYIYYFKNPVISCNFVISSCLYTHRLFLIKYLVQQHNITFSISPPIFFVSGSHG
jgi:hypothetical protein